MLRISKRLEKVASLVPEGSRLADIGSDHALLPVYLAQRGGITGAVAGEINEGPKDAASRQVRAAGLTSLIEVRLGDGLQVIAPGEVDVITIAGMGGALIASILAEGMSKLAGVNKLVLQPNVGEHIVREWLDRHGWRLAEEHILEEDGKIYEIIAAVPDEAGASASLYKEQTLCGSIRLERHSLYSFGPMLVRNPSPVWFAKWEQELAKLAAIADQLGRSEAEASRLKREELQAEIRLIREVLECLQKDKPSFN